MEVFNEFRIDFVKYCFALSCVAESSMMIWSISGLRWSLIERITTSLSLDEVDLVLCVGCCLLNGFPILDKEV